MLDRPLPRSFYDRPVIDVARDLLGKRLLRSSQEGRTAGRIVEVEAYQGPFDPASHAYRGQTRRNASMFGPPGHAYVYSIHAKWCVNVVTEPEGQPMAVLLRAVQPLEGLALMERRRGTKVLRDLTRGPARLCQAYAIDRRLDGWDLTLGRRLWIAETDDAAPAAEQIIATPRIGVTSAKDSRLRFVIAKSRFASGAQKLNVP